jgi:hypothetical protein
MYGYVLFLSKQVLDVQESYMYPFRSSLFGGCIATSILLRLNIPLCFDLEYFPFTTLLRSGDFYSEDQV